MRKLRTTITISNREYMPLIRAQAIVNHNSFGIYPNARRWQVQGIGIRFPANGYQDFVTVDRLHLALLFDLNFLFSIAPHRTHRISRQQQVNAFFREGILQDRRNIRVFSWQEPGVSLDDGPGCKCLD